MLAIAAYLNVLETLGLTDQRLQNLQAAAGQRSVTLRLRAEEHCKFLRTTVREVESPTAHVTTYSFGVTRKDTVVTKITEHFWQFDAKYELVAFQGNESDRPLAVLQSRAVYSHP